MYFQPSICSHSKQNEPSSGTANKNSNLRGLAPNQFSLNARELAGVVDDLGTVWSYSSGTQWYEHTSDHDYLGIWNENHRDDHSVYLTSESGTERQGNTARIDLYLAQVVTCSAQCNSSTITEVTRMEVPTSPSSQDFQKYEGIG